MGVNSFDQCCGSETCVGTDPDPRIRASDQWIRIRLRILLFSKSFCLLLYIYISFQVKKVIRSHKRVGIKVFA